MQRIESTNRDSKVLHKDCLLYNTSVALAAIKLDREIILRIGYVGFSVRKLYLNGEGFVHFDDVSFIIFGI